MKLDLPEGREFTFSPAILGGIVGVVLLITAIFTSVYQVDPDEEAIVLRFGKHIDTRPQGLHFKLPFGIDAAIRIPVQRLDVEQFGYREVVRGPSRDLKEENLMLTGDLNLVRAGWRIQFTRLNPTDFLFNVERPLDTLRDIGQSVMREVMGDNASILVLTTGRAEIQQALRDKIQEICDRLEMGIRINEVNLMFVDPPKEVREAFEDLNKAEQDAGRYFEEASREYQSRVPEARGIAERMVLEARGFKDERVNLALGESRRFDSMLKEYKSAESVTRTRLFLETMESRLPLLKELIILDDEAKGILPLLNLREQ